MTDFTIKSKFSLLILSLASALLLTACSDDKPVPEVKSVAKKTVKDNAKLTPNKIKDKKHYKQMSKPLDKASWSEKGQFRNEFENDCVAREQKLAGNKADTAFIKKTCNCIANYMDDHLTDQEAEEFLGEDNHMRALQIKYDAAAFECLQEDLKAKKPKITKFQ